MNVLPLWAPGIILVGTLLIDVAEVFDFAIVAISCVFTLILISFYMSSRKVLVWALIYVTAFGMTLWMRRGMWQGASGNVEALMISRVLGACGIGLLACLFAQMRERVKLSTDEFYRVLSQLSVPVITSDSDGWFIFLNDSAQKLLGCNAASGSQFFSHFSAKSEKGTFIRKYFELTTGTGPRQIEMDMEIKDHNETFRVTMARTTIGGQCRVFTIIQANKAVSIATESLS